jgi:hypothetical protein
MHPLEQVSKCDPHNRSLADAKFPSGNRKLSLQCRVKA